MNFPNKYKYSIFIILISAFILIFTVCQRQPTKPEETKIRIVLEYTGEIKKELNPFQPNDGTSLSKLNSEKNVLDLQAIDQANILILDMTKWKDIQEFDSAWTESGQELGFGAMPETITWDWYANIFRNYQGEYFYFYGDWDLNIENDYAEGTFRVNPGLNFLILGFVENKTMTYIGWGTVIAVEGEETPVEIQVLKVYQPGAPLSLIYSPQDSSIHNVGQSITFEGYGYDDEDGDLSGSSLVWTSDIDGQIGTGESFTKNDLSLGTHEITLTATDSDGKTDSDRITIFINQSVFPVIATIDVGEGPDTPVITPGGAYVYVANQMSYSVSVISTETNTVVATIPVGWWPKTPVITPDGKYIYMPIHNGQNVTVISTATHTAVDTVITSTNITYPRPETPAITPDGAFIYVPEQDNDKVSVISTQTNTVIATVRTGDYPFTPAITPNGEFVYVSNWIGDNVAVISTASNQVVATVDAGDGPRTPVITFDGSFVYVPCHSADIISVISTATNTVVAIIEVGNGPHKPLITPNGDFIYVPNYYSDDVSVISLSTNSVVATIDVGSTPYAPVITPDGAYVFVPNWGSNTVSVISTETNKVVENVSVGSSPYGLAISPDGGKIYVSNYHSNNVSVIEYAP